MPQKLAAGNWKMNGTPDDLAEIAALEAGLPEGLQVLICPPATLVAQMAAAATRIAVGGQDCHASASGAHTGDIAAGMLKAAGASHVITGHSERRTDHGETDADVAAKTAAAHAAGLVAVLCLGETLDEREAGETLAVIDRQLDGSLPDGATAANTVIAYEPVWAIGTGKVPTTAQIAEVHAHLRARLAERLADGAEVTLLYGGSVKASNAAEIFAVDHVNGALVGGASLKAADFGPIARALAEA